MHILLVEPDYYTRFPPLGLLKLASYHKSLGDTVELVRGERKPEKRPSKIYVTSLFTYAWRPVHRAVRYYRKLFPDTKILLGGIYASLLPEHATMSGAEVYTGLHKEAEKFRADYSLVPGWDGSILFTSRGCIRNCGFCSVPKLEGRPNSLEYSIKHLIYPGHTKIILWDNNILASRNWKAILDELNEIGLKVDFNQGLDARLITDEVAGKLARLKMDVIRVAYDQRATGKSLERAIERLHAAGVRKRKILAYTLFNYTDDPQDFFERVRDQLNWGFVSYPMRFEPLCSLEKNKYVAPKWDRERLNMVARARRVIGYVGAFPPYEGLVKKFDQAENFDEAFSLRPYKRKDQGVSVSVPIHKAAQIPSAYLRTTRKKPRWGGGLDWRRNIR